MSQGNIVVGILLGLIALARDAVFAEPVVVSSPGGGVKAEISSEESGIHYSISLDGQQVLAPSSVVIRSDGFLFGKEGTLGTPELHEVNESYPFFGGKSKAVNHARLATLPVTTGGEQYHL